MWRRFWNTPHSKFDLNRNCYLEHNFESSVVPFTFSLIIAHCKTWSWLLNPVMVASCRKRGMSLLSMILTLNGFQQGGSFTVITFPKRIVYDDDSLWEDFLFSQGKVEAVVTPLDTESSFSNPRTQWFLFQKSLISTLIFCVMNALPFLRHQANVKDIAMSYKILCRSQAK